MNRHGLGVAALLFSATFGMGCLAPVDGDDNAGVASSEQVVAAAGDTALRARASEVGGGRDGSMTIADFAARTERAASGRLKHWGAAGTLTDAVASPASRHELGGADYVMNAAFGPDPQPWLDREDEDDDGNYRGPDPQPW
ncbi:MAG TPA: hypothetical protein ENK23_00910 [Sorangium sp.]|nr:hypothetical protein [Sorangium sp.]